MDRSTKLAVTLACISAFVVILDATIVAVALPQIRRELGFSTVGLGWVVNAYTLAFAGFQLFGGRCVDVFGLRPVLWTGLALFALGSLGAGLAFSPWVMLSARVVQGLGGAMLIPSSLASITSVLPDGPRRASALALWSMVGAVGSASGTVLGGVFTELTGWGMVFLINLPILAFAATLPRVLPKRADGARRARLDAVGAVLVTSALTLLVAAIVEASPVLGVVGLVVLLGFLWFEHRGAREPMLPLGLFRLRTVTGANLTMFAFGLGFFTTPVLLSVFLQGELDYSPLQAGLAFAPSAAATVLAGKLAGRWTPRFGTRRVALPGMLIAVLGFAVLASCSDGDHGYLLGIGVPVILIGLGVGLAFTPLTVAANRGVANGRGGIAAGLLNTTRQTSGATGVAICTAISAGPGYPSAFAVVACCALLAVLLAFTVLPRDHAARLAPC